MALAAPDPVARFPLAQPPAHFGAWSRDVSRDHPDTDQKSLPQLPTQQCTAGSSRSEGKPVQRPNIL